MPLMSHRINSLALDIHTVVCRHVVGVDHTTGLEEPLKEALREYFKDKIVICWERGDIESVADDMDLKLADDEIEFLAKQVQDDHDCTRGISWPNLENAVEKWYLEDTQSGMRKNAPDFHVVKVDDTSDWEEKFRLKHGISKIYTVYLVDKNQVTHCCELTPSYALYYVGYVAEHVDAEEQISDECDMEIMSQHQESVTYLHVSDFDKAEYEEQYWRPEPLTTDMYKEEEDYREMVNQLLEDYHANPFW